MSLHVSLLGPSRVLILTVSVGLLAGCQSFDAAGLTPSVAPTELSAPAASAIAGDLVPRLAEQIGQGKPTIVLKPDGSLFGTTLEASLRTWGYAVTTAPDNKDAKTIHLTYVVAPTDGQILARLSTTSLQIGRVYTPTPSGATPASPLSVMQRS